MAHKKEQLNLCHTLNQLLLLIGFSFDSFICLVSLMGLITRINLGLCCSLVDLPNHKLMRKKKRNQSIALSS